MRQLQAELELPLQEFLEHQVTLHESTPSMVHQGQLEVAIHVFAAQAEDLAGPEAEAGQRPVQIRRSFRSAKSRSSFRLSSFIGTSQPQAVAVREALAAGSVASRKRGPAAVRKPGTRKRVMKSGRARPA